MNCYLHMFCRKRYEKAEHEFVEAKMDLHRKTERKDLLTEHLYTIIRENELRKAKKLEELMAKLNVAPDHTAAFVQQNNVLEVRNDESTTKQNHAQIPVLQEEKASIATQGMMSSESKDSLEIDRDVSSAASKQNKDDTVKDSVNDVNKQSEATVTDS